MILMSHVPTEAALCALLGRAMRQPRAASSSAVACTDAIAVHDAAALREGTLSPAGIHRLAHHLSQCESCRILIAFLVDDAQRAEWTGKHDAATRLVANRK
jgi:hypothetical protein